MTYGVVPETYFCTAFFGMRCIFYVHVTDFINPEPGVKNLTREASRPAILRFFLATDSKKWQKQPCNWLMKE